jgi:aspartate 1-decarboxylase
MLRKYMHSKIHRATVTDSDLSYVGSITISPELLQAAEIGVHELVHVVNINNGARFETYTILDDADQPPPGQIVINGAAARLVQAGDKVIIISYADLTEDERIGFKSRVVHVNDTNEIIGTTLQSS